LGILAGNTTGASDGDVTRLLSAWGAGDETALDRLIPLVYEELRRRAERYMAYEQPGHTLQTTALVNEVYLRLIDLPQRNWENRTHFLAVCAQLMRRILVDFARSRLCQRRGGRVHSLALNEALTVCSESPREIVAVNDALENLSAFDARKARVVELRFFGGLGVQETAEVLKISPETVMRDWKMAKIWLIREIKGSAKRGR
jgi:RNA polymerase sigma factor (TIGR02999 family)